MMMEKFSDCGYCIKMMMLTNNAMMVMMVKMITVLMTMMLMMLMLTMMLSR